MTRSKQPLASQTLNFKVNDLLISSGFGGDSDSELSERERFSSEYDANGDGFLDGDELRDWIAPDNVEIANDEVSFLSYTSPLYNVHMYM